MIFSLVWISSCAVLTESGRDLYSADSLSRNKKYSDATATYRKMLQEHPDSLYAADARYGLAMSLVAFDNPQKDYAQALREFEEFAKLSPEDSRMPDVQNWIAVLKTLSDRNRSLEQLKRLDIRHEERRRK